MKKLLGELRGNATDLVLQNRQDAVLARGAAAQILCNAGVAS